MNYHAATRLLVLSPLALALHSVWASPPDDEASAPTSLAPVTVYATTPLPGIGQAKEEIPALVQHANTQQLSRSGALDLTDFMNRELSGVHLNEVQGNPFMPEVNYRGYTASPLLGTPQGLSVYMDGVRLNQPFGDTVLWDLIPRSAISSLTLMPGSNPLFGLNTLGGALSLQTKDGRSTPGTSVEALYGSHQRRSLSIEHGGSNEHGLDWYVTGNLFRDQGWREDSPSQLGQFFGKLGWQDARTRVQASYAYANNRLNGNGMQTQEGLANSYSSIFTKPDITDNLSHFFNLSATHQWDDNTLLSGNVYYRNTHTSTLNADLNEGSLGQAVYYTGQTATKNWLAANGYGNPAAESSNSRSSSSGALPMWRCITEAATNGEPNEKCTGLLNRTHTRQENFGVTTQIARLSDWGNWRNQLTIGAGWDFSRIRFSQSSQFGYLNADRSITPVNAYADGTQNSENAFDQRVELSGRQHTVSVYATDTLSWNDRWHFTVAGRANRTQLSNRDSLYPYNNAITQGEQRGSLDGDHTFQRFNPSLGVSYVASPALNTYLSYSESSRAPTSIELGCADPNFGCRLPNSMAGDPALKQVVARTWETGVRGEHGQRWHWQLGAFHAENSDDILFVANSASTGYFRNFGKTLREGIEGSVGYDGERLNVRVSYTQLNATYQSSETVGSPYNSSADANGNIQITPGNRIPLIPSRILKVNTDYQFTGKLRSGVDFIAVSNSYARGNENNAQDGSNGAGSGKVPGYAVVNWSASYQHSPSTRFFTSVSNLFDRRYATAGQLGPMAFNANGGYTNSDTLGTMYSSPGAPRMIWVGVRYTLD